MKTLLLHKVCSVTLAMATVAFLAVPVSADDPAAAPQLFALTGAADCVDWESDDSRRIVAHRAGNDWDVIQFGTPDFIDFFAGDFLVQDDDGDIILDLRDTTWVQVPVLHITDSGAEHLRDVYWLVDTDSTPDTGLTASTGPDGDVCDLVEIRITRIGSENGDNSGKFRITLGAGGELFCVSVGTFNK